jgi:hypothetical protein
MHGKNYKENTGYLYPIFQKDKEGKYTENSKLYQDILRYSIDGKYKEDDNSFRTRNLAKWLLEKNIEFSNYFKEPSTRHFTISSRIENKLDRIKKKIKDLINFGLIEQSEMVKETKGNGLIPLYRFTKTGYLVAWSIESKYPDRSENAINEIYNLMQENFRESPASNDIFFSIFYRKCRDAGLFSDIVALTRRLLELDEPIIDFPQVFQHLILRPLGNTEKSVEVIRLWDESFNELDHESKLLFLHQIKLVLDISMGERAVAFREYEKLRFKIRDRPDIIALEGYCEDCSLYTPAGLSTIEYIHTIQLSPQSVTGICPTCKKHRSLVFPVLF